MPTPPPSFRPGQPFPTAAELNAISESAAAAGNVSSNGPLNVITGRQGTQLSAAEYPQLALVEITSTCQPTYPKPYASSTFPTQCVWYWAKVVYYFRATDTWHKQATDPNPLLVYHPQGYQTDLRTALQAFPAFMPAYTTGDWVWAIFNPLSGFWEIIETYEHIVRVKLTAELDYGQSAAGKLIIDTATGWSLTVNMVVHDALGAAKIARGEAGSSSGPNVVANSGDYVYAKYFADTGWWEVFARGNSTTAVASYGGMHKNTAAPGSYSSWVNVTFDTNEPVTADVTLQQSPGRITFVNAGTYLICAAVSVGWLEDNFTPNPTAQWKLRLTKGGTQIKVQTSHLHDLGNANGAGWGYGDGHCSFPLILTVAAGDYIELEYCWENYSSYVIGQRGSSLTVVRLAT